MTNLAIFLIGVLTGVVAMLPIVCNLDRETWRLRDRIIDRVIQGQWYIDSSGCDGSTSRPDNANSDTLTKGNQ